MSILSSRKGKCQGGGNLGGILAFLNQSEKFIFIGGKKFRLFSVKLLKCLQFFSSSVYNNK